MNNELIIKTKKEKKLMKEMEICINHMHREITRLANKLFQIWNKVAEEDKSKKINKVLEKAK